MGVDVLALVAAIVQTIDPSRDAPSRDADAAARSLEQLLRERLGLEDAVIFMVEPTGALRAKDRRAARDDALGASVRSAGKPVRASVDAHPFEDQAARLRERGVERLVAVPLAARAVLRGIAVLAFLERSPAAQLVEDELAVLGNAMGIALEQARLAETSRVRVEVHRALLEAARFAATSADLESVLDRHAEALARIASALRCGIALPKAVASLPVGGFAPPRSVAGSLRSGAQVPGAPGSPFALRAVFGATEEDRAALRDLPLATDPAIARALETGRLVTAPSDGGPTLAVLPLVAHGIVRGVAFLAREGELDEEARTLLEAVGHEVALAIEAAEERDAASRERGRAALEADVRRAVHASFDLDRILEDAAERLGRELRVNRCLVGLIEPSGATVVGHEYRDPRALPSARGWRFERSERAMLSAIRETPGPVVVNDVVLDGRFGSLASIAPGDYRAFILGPFERTGPLGGGILAGSIEPRAWTAEEVRLVAAIAEQCAIAVERARIHEDALRRADELELILSQMTDGLVICDDRLQVVRVNDAARRILFHHEIGPLPLPVNFSRIEVLDADRRPLALEDLPLGAAILRGETTTNRILIVRERPTGHERWIACSGSPVHERSGRRIGGLFVFRDVTEARAAAENANRTEKLRVLGELAASVAHELNNTLAAVLGRAEFIQSSTHEAETRRNVDVIAAAARDATHVLGRLTRLSHRPRVDAPRVLVDLVEVVADAIELTRPRWSRIPGVSVALAPEGEAIAAFGVPAELREVLTNLILNAADALGENGSIRIELRCDSELARIRVADTGCGMSEEVLLRAFEPFFTTKGDAGTGLGLNICSAIVTAHGGRIEARSTPSRGTTIEITLPTSDDSETPRQPVVATRLRILVVDDDPRVLSVLADVLAQDGHEIETAASGEEALERALGAPGPPRVLVTDISMPGMSGIHLAEEVVGRFPQTAVVLVSGWAASASSETLEKLGASVVTKPFSASDVRSAIGRAMGRKPS